MLSEDNELPEQPDAQPAFTIPQLVGLAIQWAGAIIAADTALAVLGAVILPVIGYGDTATAAGSLAHVAQTAVVGAGVFGVPFTSILAIIKVHLNDKDKEALDRNFEVCFIFQGLIAMGGGAVLLGNPVDPMLNCMLAGQVTACVVLLALLLIMGVIVLGKSFIDNPAADSQNNSPTNMSNNRHRFLSPHSYSLKTKEETRDLSPTASN